MKKIDEYKMTYKLASNLAEEARLKAATHQASVRLSDAKTIRQAEKEVAHTQNMCQLIDHMNLLVDEVGKNFKVSK